MTAGAPIARTPFIVDASPLASVRFSGVGHSVFGFISALAADPEFTARYQIQLVAPYNGMKFIRALKIPGVVYRPIPLPARVWNRLPGTPLMPPMDLFLGGGVYFLTNFRGWPLMSAKSMVMIHDIAFRLFPDSLTPRHRSFLEHNVPRWIKRATVIVTPSASAKHDIAQHLGVNPKRIAVIPNGVDPAKFNRRPLAEVESVRAKYLLPSDYILFVGNLEPRKNLARLINAYTGLPHDLHEKYALVLIGGAGWLNGELEDKITQAQAAGARIIRPTGYVTDSDLPAVFTGARLLAWPTLHEGFGMPILEAMATGTPVLTARNSSLPEVAGDAALYVDESDEQDISRGLQRLLTDEALRRQLIAAGHSQASRLTWAAAARKLATLTDKLAPQEHKLYNKGSQNHA
jgi:glycosyltransferase involved in cell wall biosynthesis